MLEKRDVLYYRRLAYTQGAIGLVMLGLCFVTGVAANYHMAEIHLFAPYWVAIPILLQGIVTMAAARTGKRWPLGLWIPLFILAIVAITIYIITMPAYQVYFYDSFPCYIQTNYAKMDTRCICASSSTSFLKINGASTIEPCIRALNMMTILSHVSYMFAILALIPELLMFVLVCNDMCCLSCRRAALVPRVVVTGGTQPGQPAQYLPVQQQTVTYRTDEEQPGSSAPGPAGQAGPLPQKPGNPGKPVNPAQIPHSF